MSKLTDYGTVILTTMAGSRADLHTAAGLAEATHLGSPTVAKILKALAHAGLVRSYRGPHGGYVLARSAENITAAEIIDALEGPVAITECSSDESHCELEHVCNVGGAWQRINVGIRRALDDITLAQLAKSKPGPALRMDLAGSLPPADR